MAGTPFAYHGEPVLVPGSMGASSFILAGQGNAESLASASHGAGRTLVARRGGRGTTRSSASSWRSSASSRRWTSAGRTSSMRRDIVEKKLADIKQEAPHAYKGIGPIVETLTDAGIARPVAELTPLMTIKG